MWRFDKVFSFLKEHASADSAQRIKVMLDACMHEVRKHDEALAAILSAVSAQSARGASERRRYGQTHTGRCEEGDQHEVPR